MRAHPRIHQITEAVSDQGQPDYGDDHGSTGEQNHVGCLRDCCFAIVDIASRRQWNADGGQPGNRGGIWLDGRSVGFEDADLAKAVPAISEFKFECAGQSCNAPSRILVARPLYEEFLSRMTDVARKIKIGPPDDPTTEMGPMANARRIEAMERLVKDAVDRGASIDR
ncbi:aldehyde dehydrogenase family protein [Mesorhizobium sp. M1182]